MRDTGRTTAATAREVETGSSKARHGEMATMLRMAHTVNYTYTIQDGPFTINYTFSKVVYIAFAQHKLSISDQVFKLSTAIQCVLPIDRFAILYIPTADDSNSFLQTIQYNCLLLSSYNYNLAGLITPFFTVSLITFIGLPNYGTVSGVHSSLRLDMSIIAEGKTILPPLRQIVFTHLSNQQWQDYAR